MTTQTTTKAIHSTQNTTMATLKRPAPADEGIGPNLSSKTFVRTTKSGKVQKIVREVYLRQDIPCSSQLCMTCQENAPRDASGHGTF